MPPLTRQESRPSIYSWWSDSNPGLQGPTINLHAAAKPLMRLMYYRQASDILRKNRDSPLTTAILETYASYFPWDYVSWATKAAILSELADRTEFSEVEARAVVDSPVCSHIAQMLGSPHPQARICSCRLLKNLARFKSIAPAVLELEPCEQLVFLLDDKDSGVICDATATLTHLSRWVDGAKRMVDAKVLDHVLKFLKSPNPDTRERASELVGQIASHESTAPAVLKKLNPSMQFVSLLGGEYHRQALDIIGKNCGSPLTTAILETYASYFRWNYVSWATKAAILSELSDRAESSEVEARTVADALVLSHITPMLESPDPRARICSCRLLRNLAQYESIAPAVLELEPYEQLVFLLDDKDSGVICDATATLAHLSRWVDGAKGVVDAKVPDHVLRLLESPKADTRESASKLVWNLACHESTAPAVLKLNSFMQLESLLGGEYHRQALDIIRKNHGSPLTTVILETYASYFRWNYVLWATKAEILSELNNRVEFSKVEAHAVVVSPVFLHIAPMLESPDPRARICSCWLLGNLAWFESTAPAVLELKPCEQLVFLLSDNKHSDIIREATNTLSKIARSVDGAEAVVDAKALDHVLPLLESPNPDSQKWACVLMGNLALYESTAPAILELNPSVQLMSLLGDEDPFSQAAYALSQIARWPDGAKAVVDAKALDHVLRLLESPNPYTRRWACGLAGQLALHEPTAPATLKLNPSVQLVSLLGDEDSFSPAATYALSQIARWPDGAKAVVDAKALDHVLALLQSFNPYTREWACELTGNLAHHKSTAPNILKLQPCVRIVSLLGDRDSAIIPMYALSQIARWRDGAKGVVDAKALDYVLPLLASPNPDTQRWAYQLAGNLASHKSTIPAILERNISVQLVSLWNDENSNRVAYLLSQIARWLDGAQAIIDAKVADRVSELLESSNRDTRKWTCILVARLASHEATALAILQLKPIPQLEYLLRDPYHRIRDSAISALEAIRQWPDRVAARTDSGNVAVVEA